LRQTVKRLARAEHLTVSRYLKSLIERDMERGSVLPTKMERLLLKIHVGVDMLLKYHPSENLHPRAEKIRAVRLGVTASETLVEKPATLQREE